MTDIIKKIFSNRTHHNGYAITGVTKTGQYESLEPLNHYPIQESGIRAKYETRLDDVRYYTGDSAA